LLDVGCGTGGHLRHLCSRYDVCGVDLNPHMLAEARKHLGEVPLYEADMRTLALGTTFDAVICLFSAVGYMRDSGELDDAIGAMARHLRPGGVLVVDGWVRPDAWREGGSTFLQVASNADIKVARVGRSRRDGVTTHLEMHYLIATAGGIDHLVEHHALTLFSPEDYETALERAGLALEVVDSPMDGRDRYLGVKAR
jgi:SAM-dependent methyltransferase